MTLVVVYRIGGPQAGQGITVVGRDLGASTLPPGQGPIDRATVFINAQAAMPKAATQSLQDYDSYVRNVAHSIGIAPSAIELRDMGFN